MNSTHLYHTMLSIAGSDPSGGAGIQADIKTATALGVYAMTAITAVTVQNTCGVRSFRAVDPHLLRAQIDAVMDDIVPGAIKIGMLPTADAIAVAAETLRETPCIPSVLDPVLVSTSGHSLADADTLPDMRRLCSLATVVTPNVPELEALTGVPVRDAESLQRAIDVALNDLGIKALLVKCGHLTGSEVGNILACRHNMAYFPSARIETLNTHGTGCSLSSAIASFLAHGQPLAQACASATAWLHSAISAGADMRIGHGHGPVNHLFNIPEFSQDCEMRKVQSVADLGIFNSEPKFNKNI